MMCRTQDCKQLNCPSLEMAKFSEQQYPFSLQRRLQHSKVLQRYKIWGCGLGGGFHGPSIVTRSRSTPKWAKFLYDMSVGILDENWIRAVGPAATKRSFMGASLPTGRAIVSRPESPSTLMLR